MASGGVLATKPPAGGTYSYSSQPRAVEQRKKYRDSGPQAQEGDPSVYGNIMYDRRIVRGNTYALHTLPASAQPDPLELQRQQEARRRALARRKAREQLRTRTPEPVDGRKHTDVQTEVYLEEITDRVIEAEACTQTDAFLDRPPTPLFVPAKTGMDAATQIEEGDLFDFDIEVRPLLEVLVGKTVEQALMEVMEEEELAALRRQQREFEERRNAEYVEVQRLEEQERRRTQEKECRMRQQREALLKEKETSEKVAARAFAQGYLSDLVPSVFSNLSRHGFFYDTVEREIETVFIPWLMDHVQESATQQLTARTLLDGMICEILRRKLGIEEAPPPDGEGEEAQEGGEKTKMVGETPPPGATSAEDTQQVKTEEQRVFGQVGQTAGPAGEKEEGGEGLAGDSQGETLEGQPPPSASEKEEGKEPTTEDPPPTTKDPPPTTEDPPPTTEDLPPTTEDPPSATEDPPTTTEDPPPATEDPPTTTEDPPPTTEDPPTTTEDPPPATEDPPPATEDPPPATEDPPTTTEDPPPTTEEPPTTEDPPSTTEGPPHITEEPPTGEDPPSTEDPPTGEDPPSTEDPPTATDPPAEEATVENDNA